MGFFDDLKGTKVGANDGTTVGINDVSMGIFDASIVTNDVREERVDDNIF